MKSPNTVQHIGQISRVQREARQGHRALVVWLTGLSGSGKSTLAHLVEERLFLAGKHVYVLDGDNVRHGLCGDLKFSAEDRTENIRRVAEMAKLFVETGTIVLTAFISPAQKDRERAKAIIGAADVLEIYIDCPLQVCESRDVKGIYKLARAGKITDFTGVSSPYEQPIAPDLTIQTDRQSVEESVANILQLIETRIQC